jgi:ankyrin repeat protein
VKEGFAQINPSKTDNPREKAFHQALTSGDLATVAKLLDEGFSANHRSERMQPPMAIALSRGNVDLARLLLQRGYEINGPLGELDQRTALMQSFERMSRGQAAPVAPIFELLLSVGADLNVRDKYGATMAHIVAASRNDKSELLARLCTMGLRLDVVDNFGETPFIEANRNGNLKCAEFLMQKGADVNQRGRNKKTALIVAGQRGLLEVCRRLLSKGADLHTKDDFNKTALEWARANKHQAVVELLEKA